MAEMRNFYDHCVFNRVEIVSFNGLHFDTPIINFVLDTYTHIMNSGKSLFDFCKSIKQFTNLIIDSEEWWKAHSSFRSYRSSKFNEIDLYCYWSKELRIAKGISLKKLGVQVGYPVVQDLPFDPNENVGEANIPLVIEYNIRDIEILRALMDAKFNWQGQKSSFEEMLQLRKDMVKEFGLPESCYSWDGVKLGVNILLQSVPLSKRPDLIDANQNFAIGSIIHKTVKFDPVTCQVWYEKKNEATTASCFHAMVEDLKKKKPEDPIKYRVYHHGATYDLGRGGLHTKNAAKIYDSRPGYRLITADVASYYPRLAGLFKSLLSRKITELMEARMALKAVGLGKSPKANGQKLAMNGSIGQTYQDKSAIFNPKFFYSITINGQLMLLMLIEKLTKLPGVEVVVANTDGFEAYCPEDQYDKFMKICTDWEAATTMELEYDEYSKIIMKNVNNYLALPKGGGKPKTKGLFVLDPDLGNSVDFLIVPKMLHEYYLKGIKPEVSINQIPFDIKDYCGAQKVSRQFEVVWGHDTLPQRLNRYYLSTQGKALYKKKKGNIKLNAFPGLSGKGVVIFNDLNEALLPIDQQFYIQEAYKIINEIEPPNRSLFD